MLRYRERMSDAGNARRGIYAAAVSPFTASGELDVAKLVAYCRFLLDEGGCDGVAPMGTTGEGTSVPTATRLALPAALARAGIPPGRVILGTGAASVDDAVALTRAALECGFNNVLVLPPFYYKSVSDEGLYAAYARLIEQVGDARLRVYLYHFPAMSQTPISPDLVRRLRTGFGPLVAGLKDSTGDFAVAKSFVEATGGVDAGFDVFPANETLLLDGLEVGCAGVISGSTNAFAPLARAALQTGGPDREAAMARLRAARAAATKFPTVPTMKQIQAWRSGDDGWLRVAPPLMPLSDAQARELRVDLEAQELAPA